MDRCNELCTKDTTGYCALCEALAERDRFERLWFQKGVFRRGFHILRQWLYPVPRRDWEVRHQAVVREAHKQYSETINKVMFTLLSVALFCLLTTLGSPDKLLLEEDSTIKIPFTDTLMSFLGFSIVVPLLLLVLTVYLHIFFGYWLDCERERQLINQRLVRTNEPPIESIPTLFSFPDISHPCSPVVSCMGWCPWSWGSSRGRRRQSPYKALSLMCVTGFVTCGLVFLQLRRCPTHHRPWRTPVSCISFF